MKRKLHYRLPKTIYPNQVYLLSFKEAEKRDFNIDYNCLGHCFDNKDGNIVICLNIDKYKLSTVVHECIHATMMVLDRAGVEISENNSEALCYLNDFIFNAVYNKLQTIKQTNEKA